MFRTALPLLTGLAGLRSNRRRRLQLLVLASGVAVVVGVTVVSLLVADVSDVDYWRALGYPGVLLLNFIGAAAMVLPIPGTLAVCGAAWIELNPLAVGILAGLGEGVGELSGYAIGYGGRAVVERRRFYHKLRRFMVRRGTTILFIVSAIPNPIFDFVGIAAGATNFPLVKFIPTVLAGKTVKMLTVAYACFYGVKLLPWVN